MNTRGGIHDCLKLSITEATNQILHEGANMKWFLFKCCLVNLEYQWLNLYFCEDKWILNKFTKWSFPTCTEPDDSMFFTIFSFSFSRSEDDKGHSTIPTLFLWIWYLINWYHKMWYKYYYMWCWYYPIWYWYYLIFYIY